MIKKTATPAKGLPVGKAPTDLPADVFADLDRTTSDRAIVLDAPAKSLLDSFVDSTEKLALCAGLVAVVVKLWLWAVG